MPRMPKINPVGRRGLLLLGFLGILFSIFALAVILNTDWLLKTGNNFLYDSRFHYLSCDELPTSQEVARVFSEHQEVVRKIEQVHPGFVRVNMGWSCPGKSDIIIEYATHRDRIEIEKIINGDTFFGIPYSLINV